MVLKHIAIEERLKARLDLNKIHPRETYDDIIRRLLNSVVKTKEEEE